MLEGVVNWRKERQWRCSYSSVEMSGEDDAFFVHRRLASAQRRLLVAAADLATANASLTETAHSRSLDTTAWALQRCRWSSNRRFSKTSFDALKHLPRYRCPNRWWFYRCLLGWSCTWAHTGFQSSQTPALKHKRVMIPSTIEAQIGVILGSYLFATFDGLTEDTKSFCLMNTFAQTPIEWKIYFLHENPGFNIMQNICILVNYNARPDRRTMVPSPKNNEYSLFSFLS